MSARFLLGLFDTAYAVALAAWVGSLLFFSFGVAPVIFKVLGAEAGGRFVRALFPRYYLWGTVAGAVALPAYLGVPLSFPEYRGPMVAVQALAIVSGTLLMLYGGNSLVPATNAARDAGPAGHDRFDRLHRRSVRLNAVAMALVLGLLVAFANRPAPRTAGIVEMTPDERARYDARMEELIEQVEAGQTPVPERAGAGRFPVDEAAVKELVEIYNRKRRHEAGRSRPARP